MAVLQGSNRSSHFHVDLYSRESLSSMVVYSEHVLTTEPLPGNRTVT